MCLFAFFCHSTTWESSFNAASSNSDVTDSGLDLIPPPAVCRPQDSAPLCAVQTVSVKINLQVWRDLHHPRRKKTKREKNLEKIKKHRHPVKHCGARHGQTQGCRRKNHELWTQCDCKRRKSHDEEKRKAVPAKVNMPKSLHSELTIQAYPKNVNLPVLGRGNLPSNRWNPPKPWGEKKKERGRYLKPAALRSLSTCYRLSDSLLSLARNRSTTPELLLSFFLPSL